MGQRAHTSIYNKEKDKSFENHMGYTCRFQYILNACQCILHAQGIHITVIL